ncbi:hypothetical protein [Streptomyces adelaidensis]|uniref:hypothetical protein n=1 Tax=Streptomyces adelaidensis TaxID=2796465 RepID=UPI001903FE3C|nr:hypothetical protein [Streptomyces adelaidensis]
MRSLVSRGLLVSPLVCGALVLGPVGAATAAVDAGRTASDRIASDRGATGLAAAPDPDVDDFLARFDALDKEIDALLAKHEADVEALLAKLDLDLGMDMDMGAGAGTDGLPANPGTGTSTDADIGADIATAADVDTDVTGVDADVLLTQLDTLDRMDRGDVLAPLLAELTTIAKLDADRLDAPEAARHAKALAAAHATVQQRLKKLDTTAPAATGRAAADPVGDLLATLQSAVDGLLKALTSLDLGAVLGAVTGLLSPVLGVVTGLLQPVLGLVTGLLGGGVPTVPAAPAA